MDNYNVLPDIFHYNFNPDYMGILSLKGTSLRSEITFFVNKKYPTVDNLYMWCWPTGDMSRSTPALAPRSMGYSLYKENKLELDRLIMNKLTPNEMCI